MSVVLTHECNLKCPFCVDKYRGNLEYINMVNIERAIDFAKTNKIEDILLIGGEPTLHPNVIEIARMFKSANLKIIMTTNYMFPETVSKLDGIVDCFNISYYKQKELPRQKDYESDLTLHTLIHSRQIKTIKELDEFIDAHQENGHLKFSTLVSCNDWARQNQTGSFLNDLNCEWVVLFNEMLGQIYRGSIIKRYDRVINNNAHQSYKFHVDGEISDSWERSA